MFKTRLLSGIILIVLAIFMIYSGGVVLLATLLCISLIGMGELFRVMGVTTAEDPINLLTVTSILTVTLFYLALYFYGEEYHLMIMIGGVILNMFAYVFTYPKYQARQVMSAFFSIVYVALMLSFVYQTRMMEGGAVHVWLILLCSWGCDTCAYCVGMLIGKHKMAPVLSPKKSVEGAIGGVIGAGLLGIAYGAFMGDGMVQYGVICAIGALIAMVGDLAASAIKRNQKIKDYGTLIPGHGGIMDRFDSVIFTAPVIFYLAEFLLG